MKKNKIIIAFFMFFCEFVNAAETGLQEKNSAMSAACLFCKTQFSSYEELTAHVITSDCILPHYEKINTHVNIDPLFLSPLTFKQSKRKRAHRDSSIIYTTEAGKIVRSAQCFNAEGERTCPFKSCRYKNKSIVHLVMHVFLHTNEKPYSCTQCHWAFRRPQDLESHVSARHSKSTSMRSTPIDDCEQQSSADVSAGHISKKVHT